MIKVVGLSGSLAEHSASRVALNIALNGAKKAGNSVEGLVRNAGMLSTLHQNSPLFQ